MASLLLKAAVTVLVDAGGYVWTESSSAIRPGRSRDITKLSVCIFGTSSGYSGNQMGNGLGTSLFVGYRLLAKGETDGSSQDCLAHSESKGDGKMDRPRHEPSLHHVSPWRITGLGAHHPYPLS